jgi:hypothetical protein
MKRLRLAPKTFGVNFDKLSMTEWRDRGVIAFVSFVFFVVISECGPAGGAAFFTRLLESLP